MAGYVLSPLLDHLQSIKRGVKHVAFADDLTNAKKLEEIKIWWNVLMNEGPKYGYYRQPSKSILIVRQYYKEYAERIFTGSNIKITREARNLCAALGDISFKEQYNSRDTVMEISVGNTFKEQKSNHRLLILHIHSDLNTNSPFSYKKSLIYPTDYFWLKKH